MVTEEEIIDRVHQRYTCATRIGEGPPPHKVSPEEFGHHASYVRKGIRIWGFVSESGRDKFIKMYKVINV